MIEKINLIDWDFYKYLFQWFIVFYSKIMLLIKKYFYKNKKKTLIKKPT